VAAPRQAKPDEPQPDDEGTVTTPESLGFVRNREIEVDPIQPVASPPDAEDMVEVRMAVTIEEFTYGNPHLHHKLVAGHRYRVPTHIAQYLHGLGKLSTIA
jgi:hypothetical protein